jgi:hypothetical protein
MSILLHKDWPIVRPYFRLEKVGSTDRRARRLRIEVRNLPMQILGIALKIQVPCAACGRSIYPIRDRKQPNHPLAERDRAPNAPIPGLYFSSTCSSYESPGCHRGAKARDENSRVEDNLRQVCPWCLGHKMRWMGNGWHPYDKCPACNGTGVAKEPI